MSMENPGAGPGKPKAFAAAAEIAKEKGGERQAAIAKTFESATKHISNGMKYVLGVPEGAMHLGKEGVTFAKEKVNQGKEAVVRAGNKFWEKVVGLEDRMVDRLDAANTRLTGGITSVKEKTTGKIAELSRRAAKWGLNTFAVPVEKGLEKVFNLPASFQEMRAGWAEAKAARKEERAKAIERRGQEKARPIEERIAALQQELDMIRQRYTREAANIRLVGTEASVEADWRNTLAQERRDNNSVRFGRSRAAVERLKAA